MAAALPEPDLREFVASQRWFGNKGLELVESIVVDQAEISPGPDPLLTLLLETRYGSGMHEIYQLLARPGAEEGPLLDVLADPATIRRLFDLAAVSASIASELGTIEFCSDAGFATPNGLPEVSPLSGEQSNSSVIVDGRLLVKLYRRLEPGVNPELELLRFFAHHGTANVPTLRAWWSYTGSVMTTTLGIVQRYLADATSGWDFALDTLRSDPASFVAAAGRLGEVVGELHVVLASDDADPAFAPEDTPAEAVPLLVATVDDEIQQVFDHLPDDDVVAPIVGLGDAVRDVLGSLSSTGPAGRLIRTHGDLHLGQVLHTPDDWYVIDFEGEPARSIPERRAKRSPLRDVAGMLRSFAYARLVAGQHDEQSELDARQAFLDGYLGAVERTAIVPSSPQLERLIGIFELEKAVYELRYELSHRPDWVHIPVAGIGRLLESAPV
jgi:trehalose synthase-fused probable maltokinase